MTPDTIEKYIPKIYERGDSLLAFVSKIDSIVEDIKADIVNMSNFKIPEIMPSFMLDDVGEYLQAGINQHNDDRTKRQKISIAVLGHKRRGSFNYDAKPKIDIIAGGNSQIFRSFDKDDWILVGDGLSPSAYYWSALGVDGVDDELGISLIGEGTEIEVAGNIYIDVDNSTLTLSEQEALRLTLQDIIPAYFYVHIGYLDGVGVFVEYFVLGV